MTKGEWNVWGRLRAKQLAGYKFRRQHPIGPYIVDFACVSARLVVEIDGPEHDEEEDARRDAWLGERGYHVLRFTADDALEQLDGLIDEIGNVLTTPTRPSLPSPRAGR